MSNEVLLGEATFEQLAEEIHNRSRDFFMIAHTEDGSNKRHNRIYYSHPYGALGLTVFGKVYLEMLLLEGAAEDQQSQE